MPFLNPTPLRDAKAIWIALSRFEPRKGRSSIEKAAKRKAEIVKYLLQNLRICLSQPGMCGLVLERGECSAQLGAAEVLARASVMVDPELKRPIPDKAPGQSLAF